jgi:hypothetical protein
MSLLSVLKREDADKKLIEENERTVAALDAMPAKFEAAKERQAERHKVCLALAQQLNLERTAGASVHVITDLEQKLQRSKWARDDEIIRLRIEQDNLGREVEAQTRNLILRAWEEFSEAAKASPSLIKVDYRVTKFDAFSEKRTTHYRSNHAAFSAVRDLLVEGMTTVISMQRRRITEINDFVQSVHLRLAAIDISKMEPDEISADRADEIQPREEPGTGNKGMIMPDGKVHIFANPADAGRIGQLSDRLSKLEAGRI